MKTAGIIAEFNPFHNGHKLLIDRVRRETGADIVIVLMSGDYVQRGVPAVTDRQVRTHMALLGGADLVLSYPVRYATSSAESFADHAVRLFNALHSIDFLAFGSESGDLQALSEVADVLAEESPAYKQKLQEGLKSGLSFAKARAEALPAFSEILGGPNNILAVEYLKALKRSGSSMQPFTVRREGPGHLDTETVASLSSAASVRRALMDGTKFPGLAHAIPEESFPILREDIGFYGVTSEQDFSLLLADRLWKIDSPAVMAHFLDMTEDLARTVLAKRNAFRNFDEFADEIKSKAYTRTHINRALLHLILDIRDTPEEPDSLYAHVLGFRKDSEGMLKDMEKASSVPIIKRTSEASEMLSASAQKIFHEEVRVSNLYETVRSQKSERPFRNVLSKPLVIV